MFKHRIKTIIVCALIIAAIVVFHIHYINEIEYVDGYTLAYNGREYTAPFFKNANIGSKKGLKFVGLTRRVPAGPWVPVYAENADIPNYLVFGFPSSKESTWVYFLEDTHRRLDTHFVRFDLSTSTFGELIYTTEDTFLFRDHVSTEPEYIVTDGMLISETGLEYFGCIRAYYESPQDCVEYIDICEKDGLYYLEGYLENSGDISAEYYFIKPDSELMEFVEIIKAYREVS